MTFIKFIAGHVNKVIHINPEQVRYILIGDSDDTTIVVFDDDNRIEVKGRPEEVAGKLMDAK